MPQVAVEKNHRRQGIGTSLALHVLEAATASKLKIINIDSTCTSLTGFCTALGLTRGGEQFEMKYRIGLTEHE